MIKMLKRIFVPVKPVPMHNNYKPYREKFPINTDTFIGIKTPSEEYIVKHSAKSFLFQEHSKGKKVLIRFSNNSFSSGYSLDVELVDVENELLKTRRLDTSVEKEMIDFIDKVNKILENLKTGVTIVYMNK